MIIVIIEVKKKKWSQSSEQVRLGSQGRAQMESSSWAGSGKAEEGKEGRGRRERRHSIQREQHMQR